MAHHTVLLIEYSREPGEKTYTGQISEYTEQENAGEVELRNERLVQVFASTPMEEVILIIHEELQTRPECRVLMALVPRGKAATDQPPVTAEKRTFVTELDPKTTGLIRNDIEAALKLFMPREITVHI